MAAGSRWSWEDLGASWRSPLLCGQGWLTVALGVKGRLLLRLSVHGALCIGVSELRVPVGTDLGPTGGLRLEPQVTAPGSRSLRALSG